MAHWMMAAARRAGFDGADALEFDAGAPVAEVWATTSARCGVSAAELAEAVADLFRIKTADIDLAEPTAVKLLPAETARKFGVFPLRDLDRHLELAVSDPVDPTLEQEVGFASGRTPTLRVAPPEAIAEAIAAAYIPDAAAESLLAAAGGDVDDLVQLEEESPPESVTEEDTASGPIVRLANMVLANAAEQGASDIHIQPTAAGGVVRFRVDGILRTGMQMPLPVLTRVVSRIKIMGNLDITDRLRPQDGRARVRIAGQDYDLRISTVPTRKAEKAVIRLLDPEVSSTLEETGIAGPELERIRRALENRDGIFVVTGPTGSGKTTTLYGALQEIATEDVNIMTVEDPVEYELAGLTQIQVEHAQGMTFASALRAILRQDPDIIFVGEIRDGETAEIAAQASLTGHLVLATLHTNDAVGSIRRFRDLGLDAGTVAETLRGALAQRLVRTVCSHCSVPATDPLTEEEEELVARFDVRPTVRAGGCEQCSGQGYLGRTPVTEFMTVSNELVRLILEGAAPFELHRQAAADGMRTLAESALDRVAAGQTTLEEVARVIGDSDEPASATEVDGALPGASAGHGPAADGPPPRSVEPRPDTPRAPGADPDEEAAHVLLVDDDGTNRSIARGVLENAGYRVSEAADGSEGLALLARGSHFNLMVLDLDMPMLGGREVLRAVRGSITTAGLPVLVLTGTPDPDAEIELLEAGADDYIRKPLEPKRFLTRIQATLRRAGA